ncbi:MAG: amidohydrolase [Bacteroidia bacterium]|nr:amidohydrolase [Bacteroidia bacterium]
MKKIIILFLPFLMACGESKESADLIVLNANMYTLIEGLPKAEAFAVRDGRFIGVGSSEDIQRDYRSEKVLDVNGKTVIPGLIDAHCHFYGLGLNQLKVDLVGTESFEEILERLDAFYKENPGNYLLGRGWDQNDWEVKEFPTNEELDKRYPDIPVVLERVDGHAYLVNQKALDLAGINAETNPDDGEVVRINGEETGVLVDGPMFLIDKILPAPDRATKIRALQQAEEICFDYGLTTVNDAGLDRDIIELIDSLQQAGDLKMRVYAMVSNSEENLDHFLEKGIIKTDRLNVRSVKVYGDGALGSRGAALRAPYSDKKGHYGAMITTAEELEVLASRLANSDYQMNTHAIGDSANIAVLRAYKKALEGKEDRRWKVEHAQIISAPDFDYFETGIIPSVQPTHATSDMYWAGDRLGADRMPGAYAFKELLDRAGIVALGTDFPVERVNPFHTFYASVARKDLKGYPDSGFQMKDALSREETLKGMTIWAAYSNFEEGEKGSIEAGKWADFVILNGDIMTISEEEIPTMSAEKVYLAGEQVK